MAGGSIGPSPGPCMDAPIAIGPPIGIGPPGGPANGAPGIASPMMATGPYFAITSPSFPYVMRKKNAGMIAMITPDITVGAKSTKKAGIMNNTPKKSAAFRAFS